LETPAIKKLEKFEVQEIIRYALKEDLGGYGDITSKYTVPSQSMSCAFAVCKQKEGTVLCGIDIMQFVFEEIDKEIVFEKLKQDGDFLSDRDIICRVNGPSASMLSAERTALNFLQHMSGIAALTSKFAAIASKYNVRVTDTRKTKPGLRKLEKYAVVCGGGFNHRYGLFDGVLIKDNHIVAAGGITNAVKAAKAIAPHQLKIEVEVKTFAELDEAIESKADIIMLDNMSTQQMSEAVKIIREKTCGACLVEASGGVTLESVEDTCKCGVDIISAGCITHSAPAADFSLEFE
jgi:nicotinate-nucleotide pyrophosphorylase (carboxylating)